MGALQHQLFGGIDLALRDGAVALMEMEGNRVLYWEIVKSWKKGPRSTESIFDIGPFFRQIALSITQNPRVPLAIGIDWNLDEALWGSLKPAIVKAFVVGALYAWIQPTATLLPVAPLTVRAQLGVDDHVKKIQVWRSIFPKLPQQHEFKKLNEHQRDAVVLAYVTAHLVGG